MSISFTHFVGDILNVEDLIKLLNLINSSKESGTEFFGVGVYTEDLCSKLGLLPPTQSLEARLEILSHIRGIDYVFPVTSLHPDILHSAAKKGFVNYKSTNTPHINKPKPFKIGYVPGTHDLLHSGHLENLLYAASQCEILIVGVKSDTLVKEHKNKKPFDSEKDRATILQHLDFVSDTHIYNTRDLTPAVNSISQNYQIPQNEIAIFLGSDLKNDFEGKYPNFNIVFTPRNLQNPNSPSSSRRTSKIKGFSQIPSSPTTRFTKRILHPHAFPIANVDVTER